MKAQPKATSKFTADERSQMITLAWLAGAAVSVTDQVGGVKAEAKESEVLRQAVARCFTNYQAQTSENLSTEPSTFDFDKGEALFFERCKNVLDMLEKKDTPENIDRYKTVVLDVAYTVAAAYGAGFLGRGEAVSQTENQMIDKIADAMKAKHLLDAVRQGATAKKGK